MTTKAIVEQVIDKYTAKIRIPILNGLKGIKGSTPTSDLAIATFCTLPNSSNIVNEGDVVFITFEDNDLSKPIILGLLNSQKETSTRQDIETRIFKTTSTTQLYDQTYIGNVKPYEIQMLQNIRANIQAQLDDLKSKIDALSNQ